MTNNQVGNKVIQGAATLLGCGLKLLGAVLLIWLIIVVLMMV